MSAPSLTIPASVLSVQVGRIAPLGPDGVPSGFVKSAVQGPVAVRTLGLQGDEQADLTVHGGPDKAVYLYASEHYPRWASEVPKHQPTLRPGAFGENLTIIGLDEHTVSIGDTFRIGTAELQVTQPRQPCFKLGLRFSDNTMGRHMMQTGRSGWYARVLTQGSLKAGDEIVMLRRPNPQWTIARFNTFILDRRDAVRAELLELTELEGLAEGWKAAAREAVGPG